MVCAQFELRDDGRALTRDMAIDETLKMASLVSLLPPLLHISFVTLSSFLSRPLPAALSRLAVAGHTKTPLPGECASSCDAHLVDDFVNAGCAPGGDSRTLPLSPCFCSPGKRDCGAIDIDSNLPGIRLRQALEGKFNV